MRLGDVDSEWQIARNARTIAGAEDIEQIILVYIRSMFGVEAKRLCELSSWLIETEHRNPGTSKTIRDFAKGCPDLRSYLESSEFSRLAADQLRAPVSLHSVWRLRTVMRDFDFTVSRPHQDYALWPEAPEHVAMWLALCDVDDGLAPLHVIAGSSARTFDHQTNEYGQSEIPDHLLAGLPKTVITMRYGDLLSFNPLLVHFSGENVTSNVRWSVDFRFVRRD